MRTASFPFFFKILFYIVSNGISFNVSVIQLLPSLANKNSYVKTWQGTLLESFHFIAAAITECSRSEYNVVLGIKWLSNFLLSSQSRLLFP